MSEREVFLEALDRADPAARAAYLDGACAGDPARRRRVEELLRAHEAAGGFLRTPAPGGEAQAPAANPDRTTERDPDATAPAAAPAAAPAVPRPLAEGPGTVIGPYTLRQLLGEGGMGAVFLAEQERPVRRRVALKVIKAGMDSEQVIARFEAERQALALMDHPNIAKVLDAGTTASGRPYFVMELVQGLPITRYCDDARLTPRARLELMIPVCQAVQHAHQKGVIHRDIKPSNVMVTEVDGKPVPKVIDFGIAKATDQQLTERSLFTQFGAVVGTPEYMSPEQAGLGSLDVDTRSDVYSLGVLLYELLTGTTPLEKERLRKAGFAEMLRLIREAEPPTPSSRLSGSREALPSVSARRGTEPSRLSRLVRGDLDWIVMKALEKDRARRYETANGLARDIRRHLDGDPVEAGPPSRSYRLRKFARKHRAALATAGAFAVLLVAATAISAALAVEARRARGQAEGRRQAAERAEATARRERDAAAAARTRAEGAEAQARRELTKFGLMNDFLTRDLLTQAEPEHNAFEDQVTLLEVLDRAAASVGERFRGQPELESELRRVIAGTYHGLGSMEKAEAQQRAVWESARRRLGPESVEAMRASGQLGHILVHRRRTEEAIRLLGPASEGLGRVLGPDHQDTLGCRHDLAGAYLDAGRTGEAIAMLVDVVRRRTTRLGPEHLWTLASRGSLARAYLDAGRTGEAIASFEELARLQERVLGPEHPDRLASRSKLTDAYRHAGRTGEAIAMLEEVVRIMGRVLGPEHPATLSSRHNLASAYLDAGRTGEALAMLEEVARITGRVLGPEHPATLSSRHNLAGAYLDAGRTGQALALLGEVVRLRERVLGPEHPATLASRHNLALAYKRVNRQGEAIALLEEVARLRERVLGPEHPDTLTTRQRLANGYRTAGRTAEAEVLNTEVLRLREAKLGPDHPDTIDSVHEQAHVLQATRPAAAEPLFRRALEGYRRIQGPDGPLTKDLTRDLGYLLLDSGRAAEAEPFLRALLHDARVRFAPGHPEATNATLALGTGLFAQGKLSEAEPLLRDGLNRLRAGGGPSPSQRAGLAAMFGTCLVRAGKWSEAEAVLRACQAFREANEPTVWSTFNSRSTLGESLLGQGKYAEAEPLIVSGFEGMKAREAAIPPQGRARLGEAAARVVQLYEAWGKPEEAARWREKVKGDLPRDPDAGFPEDPFAKG